MYSQGQAEAASESASRPLGLALKSGWNKQEPVSSSKAVAPKAQLSTGGPHKVKHSGAFVPCLLLPADSSSGAVYAPVPPWYSHSDPAHYDNIIMTLVHIMKFKKVMDTYYH